MLTGIYPLHSKFPNFHYLLSSFPLLPPGRTFKFQPEESKVKYAFSILATRARSSASVHVSIRNNKFFSHLSSCTQILWFTRDIPTRLRLHTTPILSQNSHSNAKWFNGFHRFDDTFDQQNNGILLFIPSLDTISNMSGAIAILPIAYSEAEGSVPTSKIVSTKTNIIQQWSVFKDCSNGHFLVCPSNIKPIISRGPLLEYDEKSRFTRDKYTLL